MSKRPLTDAEIRAQIPAARRRAERLRQTTPHAEAAHLDRIGRRIVVGLTNGASLSIPVALVPAIRNASAEDLAKVIVGPGGVGLRWEHLDADLTIGYLAGIALGARTLLRAAGAAGGAARSTAKARAARINGRRGGRPREPS